jgi:putative chitinase
MNIDPLQGVIPSNTFGMLPETMDRFNINSPLRVCHFLAQCAHESWNFSAVRENLNYSTDALLKTFPRHFRDRQEAESFARQPERIANKVYANRIGNGPPESGDGWRFRGRGFIQLTGRANYTDFNRFVSDNVIENPDLVAARYPLLSAAWFWNSRNLNKIADVGSSDEVVTRITRIVNGGTNGLADRLRHFKKYYSKFST